MYNIKFIIILFFTLLTSIIANGQNVDLNQIHPSFKNAVKELQSEEVDTIFIYHAYCTGCEISNDTANCNGFINARIFWKKSGKIFTRKLNCLGEKTQQVEFHSKAFDFFLINKEVITERKLFPKGRFYPPVPAHHNGEDFYLILNETWYKANLQEPQRENKNWYKYSWIKPKIKLSDLNKLELNIN